MGTYYVAVTELGNCHGSPYIVRSDEDCGGGVASILDKTKPEPESESTTAPVRGYPGRPIQHHTTVHELPGATTPEGSRETRQLVYMLKAAVARSLISILHAAEV